MPLPKDVLTVARRLQSILDAQQALAEPDGSIELGASVMSLGIEGAEILAEMGEAASKALSRLAEADFGEQTYVADALGQLARIARRDEDLAELPKAIKLLELAEGGSGKLSGPRQYITLDQAAALVNRSKRSLEHRKRDMPAPAVKGGGRGKPDEWLYDEIRPWLEAQYGKILPDEFPSFRG